MLVRVKRHKPSNVSIPKQTTRIVAQRVLQALEKNVIPARSA